MLNRRLIRVKVLQAVYSYHQSEFKDLKSAKSFLKKSVLGIEDTFINVVQFSEAFFNFTRLKFNPADNHLKPSEESLFKFKLLTENLLLSRLVEHPESADLFKKPSVNWTRDEEFMVGIYKEVTKSDWFLEFCENKITNFDTDRSFLIQFYKHLFEHCEDFDVKMEEISIHWSDEKVPVQKSLERLIKSCLDSESIPEVPLLSKDLDDDISYSNSLLEQSIAQHDELVKLISIKTPEWDSERIARIDLYIMTMALVEFMGFPNIPVKVTINEYLELAKLYSTPQSSKFINGILDKMLNELRLEGRVVKKGRGLVE